MKYAHYFALQSYSRIHAFVSLVLGGMDRIHLSR